MSLSSALRRAAAPTALAVAAAFTAANANAAGTIVEPTSLDFSQPLPESICFVSNEKGTAFNKLSAAMNARSQIVVATANQAIVANKGESSYEAKIFSSSTNGGEGYDIRLDVPKERMAAAKIACTGTLHGINIYNVNTLTSVPPEVNKGELGVGLRNAHAAGMKVFMTAVSHQGALISVTYNPSTGYGAISASDTNGNRAGILGNMASISYTKKAQELLQIAEAPNSGNGAVALASYKPAQT